VVGLSEPGEGPILNRLKTIQRVRPVEGVVVLFSGEAIFLFFHLSSLHDVYSYDSPPLPLFLYSVLETYDRPLSQSDCEAG
jgi:hypothetical protein